jgi:hypothetical protein
MQEGVRVMVTFIGGLTYLQLKGIIDSLSEDELNELVQVDIESADILFPVSNVYFDGKNTGKSGHQLVLRVQES